jgi:hypothetical protein
MAEHVWTILCYRASIDKDEGNVSLLHVIEELRFAEEEGPIREAMKKEGASAISTDMQLVSWFVRSDFKQPEEAQARMAILLPDGTKSDPALIPLNLTKSTGFRWRIYLPALPFVGFGYYWFIIEVLQGKRWKFCTRIPLNAKRGENPLLTREMKEMTVKVKRAEGEG